MLVQSWMKPETTKPIVAWSPFPTLFWHLIGSPYFHRPENKLVCFSIYLSDEKLNLYRGKRKVEVQMCGPTRKINGAKVTEGAEIPKKMSDSKKMS